ncbi:MAG: hypothetical protein ACRDGJ_09270 [Candidatus Limnocylindria bacterium]
MTPRLRKFALTAHVAFSVGWLGAVAGFVGLGVVGLTSEDAQTVRGAYLVMELAAWLTLLHAALALLLLLVATALAVYKPRGMTPYGQRKQREQRGAEL